MENQDFKISIKTIWVLVIGNGLLIFVALFTKLMHWELSQVLLIAGLMLFLLTWVIIFTDMLKHNIYNKSFWVSSMFCVPYFSSILYLVQRNKLIGK